MVFEEERIVNFCECISLTNRVQKSIVIIETLRMNIDVFMLKISIDRILKNYSLCVLDNTIRVLRHEGEVAECFYMNL